MIPRNTAGVGNDEWRGTSTPWLMVWQNDCWRRDTCAQEFRCYKLLSFLQLDGICFRIANLQCRRTWPTVGIEYWEHLRQLSKYSCIVCWKLYIHSNFECLFWYVRWRDAASALSVLHGMHWEDKIISGAIVNLLSDADSSALEVLAL